MWRLGTGLLTAVPVIAVFLISCSEKNTKPEVDNTNFTRRVFRPPPKGEVRAVPPHNIHEKGVGPYELGTSFQSTLSHLPHGPRVELYKAEGLFDYRLMRADDDALVIGVGRSGKVAFVSVLDPDIAKTESGVGVGAGLKELTIALGEEQEEQSGSRDERILRFSALANARFILEEGKVVAALVTPPDTPPPMIESSKGDDTPLSKGNGKNQGCRSEKLKDRRSDILKVAKVKNSSVDQMLFTCIVSDFGEAVLRTGTTIKVVAETASGGLKLAGTTSVPGLSFVAVLETGEARPELFSVTQHHSVLAREVRVNRYFFGNGKISKTWSSPAFILQAREASWIGADLNSADFLVELKGGNGVVIVGGIYVQKQKGALRHVVPVDSISLPVERQAKKPPILRDAGVVDDDAQTDSSVSPQP